MIPHACDDDEKFLCLHKRFKSISCHCDLLQNVEIFFSSRKCSKRGVREYLKKEHILMFNLVCLLSHKSFAWKISQRGTKEHKAHYFNEILSILPSCTTHTAKCTQIMLYTCLRIIIMQTLGCMYVITFNN